MKLAEIVVHMDNDNFTMFDQNQMKNKKVLLIARFSFQNFKVSVELWKSYIVPLWTYLFEYLLVVKLVYIVLFALYPQFFFSLGHSLLLVHLILNEILNEKCNFFPGEFSNIARENILYIWDIGSMTIWPVKKEMNHN